MNDANQTRQVAASLTRGDLCSRQQEQAMSQAQPTILLATDLSDISQQATAHAFAQAKAHGAKLTLLHVFDPKAWTVPTPFYFMPDSEQWIEEHMDKARLKATEHLEALASKFDGDDQVLLIDGKPGPTIVECAKAQGAEMIVVGTHGHTGWRHALLGSVAGYVTRHAHCAVLTAKAPRDADPDADPSTIAPSEIHKILVPVDFSDYSRSALQRAITLAQQHDATLQLIHVIHHLYMPSIYEQYTGSIEGDLLNQIEETSREELEAWIKAEAPDDIKYTLHVEMGGAADRIQHFANDNDSDMIVIATHGNTGIKRFFLGSVAEQVLRYVDCPVLIVR